MPSNQDFKDLFVALNAHGVEFLVVGAHALAAHGYVRATKDLDVWIRPDRGNAVRVMRAQETFGAPMHAVSEDDFAEPGITFQIGVEPVRIDIITAVDGLTFCIRRISRRSHSETTGIRAASRSTGYCGVRTSQVVATADFCRTFERDRVP